MPSKYDERPEHRLHAVAVVAQVAHDLAVRLLVGDLRRPPEVAEERDVREQDADPRLESRDRQRQATALAAPERRDPTRVDALDLVGGVDGPDGVGHQPPVVVGRRIQHAAGHVARVRRIGFGDGVRRLADGAPRALAAVVHDEVRVARGRPGEPLDGQPAAAAVADVLDDAGQRLRAAAGRPHEPRGDALSAEPAIRDVVRLEGPEARVDALQRHVDRVLARLGEGRRPERVEVGRLAAIGSVGLELLERHVERRHAILLVAAVSDGVHRPLVRDPRPRWYGRVSRAWRTPWHVRTPYRGASAMAIAFDGYTAAGRLEGRVVADPRLADLLATFTSVIIEAPTFAPIAGSLAESASYVAPGTPWTSVEVDDLFVVAAVPETVIPFHAAWHKVALEMRPYVLEGELPSLPGFDPERALARPRGAFVLLARVRIGVRPQRNGWRPAAAGAAVRLDQPLRRRPRGERRRPQPLLPGRRDRRHGLEHGAGPPGLTPGGRQSARRTQNGGQGIAGRLRIRLRERAA